MSESPQKGPPWDLPLAEAPFVFIDLEMTGLNPKTDAVVEVSATRVLGNYEETFTSFVRVSPETFAQGGSAHVHQIKFESLADAPTFSAIHAEIERMLHGAILVAHGARTDVSFLEAESARIGGDLKIPFFLDTLTLCRRSFHLSSYALSAICTHFGLATDGSHRAAADVSLLRQVWPRIVAELKPSSARDLWEVRVSERKARADILEVCEVAKKTGTPMRITYRPSRKPAQEFVFIITQVNIEAPHIQGYFWPGRGRRELRADRILRIEPA
jgi:DNA polymerase III subunit epsilon